MDKLKGQNGLTLDLEIFQGLRGVKLGLHPPDGQVKIVDHKNLDTLNVQTWVFRSFRIFFFSQHFQLVYLGVRIYRI